jgi:hypothetical protein
MFVLIICTQASYISRRVFKIHTFKIQTCANVEVLCPLGYYAVSLVAVPRLKRKALRSLRSSLFWDLTRHWLVVSCRRFRRAYLSHRQASSSPRRLLPVNYQSTLRNIAGERKPHLHRGGSLKSQTLILLYIENDLTKISEFSVTPLREPQKRDIQNCYFNDDLISRSYITKCMKL